MPPLASPCTENALSIGGSTAFPIMIVLSISKRRRRCAVTSSCRRLNGSEPVERSNDDYRNDVARGSYVEFASNAEKLTESLSQRPDVRRRSWSSWTRSASINPRGRLIDDDRSWGRWNGFDRPACHQTDCGEGVMRTTALTRAFPASVPPTVRTLILRRSPWKAASL